MSVPKLPPIFTLKSSKLHEVFSKLIYNTFSEDKSNPARTSIFEFETVAVNVPWEVETSKVTAISASN